MMEGKNAEHYNMEIPTFNRLSFSERAKAASSFCKHHHSRP